MRVGQRVACRDDSFPSWVHQLYKQLPVKGTTYTVRALRCAREELKSSESATMGVLLHEIINPPDPTHIGGGELSFKPERFAPLEEMTEKQTSSNTDAIGKYQFAEA